MKSIQTKFISLTLGCVLLCSAVVGGAGIMNAEKVVDADSANIINLICAEKSAEMDSLLSRIEQSVGTLSSYVLEQLESVQRLKEDDAYVEEFTKKLESVAVNSANNTEGALAVYVRFNPEFTHPESGFFWSKADINGSLNKLAPTDFSSYAASDTEHVGWYYIPVKNGKATWMPPYNNQNINRTMISYVIPVYKDNETIGVVGMDIDFELIGKYIDNIRVYKNGYSFLFDDDGSIFHHGNANIDTPMDDMDESVISVVDELRSGSNGGNLIEYEYNGQGKMMAFRTLRNGMRLAVTAPVKEIDAGKNRLVRIVVGATAAISALAVLITVVFTRRLIYPLKELNVAAKKISEGDLSISLTRITNDEVGMLAESFQHTVNHLKKHIDYINALAYRDSMTGVKNKTAYQEAERIMDEKIRIGYPEFAVAVMDINNLKTINDTYGHDFGDILIIEACRLICRIFKRSPVYRIGGDEFVVILEHADFDNHQKLLERFKAEIDEHNNNCRPVDIRLSIACGIAFYSNETDISFANVFKRADDAMYQNKAYIKGGEGLYTAENSGLDTEK